MEQTPRAASPFGRRIRLGLAALTAAVLFGGAAACGGDVVPAAQVASGTTGATTAAPAAGPSTAGPAAGQIEARARLRELEKSYQGRIGLYALDTGTGKTISYRENEAFPMLSTFKAMVAAAILDKARRTDPGLLERRLHWTPEEEVDGSDHTNGHGDEGMPAAELCRLTIIYSDNTAANVLLKQIGGPAGLTAFLRTLGDRRSRLDRTEPDLNIWRPGEMRDTTTPASMGADLYRVTLGNALVAEDRARLEGWLRDNTTGDERIRKGLPAGWTIGDKTGTSSYHGAANDIAIVRPPSGAPLIISIYTNRDAADGVTDNAVIARTATIAARGLGILS